ncbi:MAG: hypothetical protein C5B60_10235 [Chloroflexi bacterium]|nr:MAG: hypothetical protein C5B60_10235 [Chloroflexota bacterium]
MRLRQWILRDDGVLVLAGYPIRISHELGVRSQFKLHSDWHETHESFYTLELAKGRAEDLANEVDAFSPSDVV